MAPTRVSAILEGLSSDEERKKLVSMPAKSIIRPAITKLKLIVTATIIRLTSISFI